MTDRFQRSRRELLPLGARGREAVDNALSLIFQMAPPVPNLVLG